MLGDYTISLSDSTRKMQYVFIKGLFLLPYLSYIELVITTIAVANLCEFTFFDLMNSKKIYFCDHIDLRAELVTRDLCCMTATIEPAV